MSPKPFKAIIIGGSVAGLTLAHTFQAASIPYVLLEARDTISPQMGASIVVMPNGARILEQLGVYEKMVSGKGKDEGFMYKMRQNFVRKSDGVLVSSTDWPKLVEERLGYACMICERRQFLQSMYDQLRDKSKILLNKKVVEIEHFDDGVKVKCEDGSEFEGDLVVGADGIHSRTRREMQRLAEETGPPGLMDEDKNSITAEYACFFGISTPMPELPAGESHTTADINLSSLLFVGLNSIPQWFLFTKLPRRYPFSQIPRYTKQEMEQRAEEHKDFHFTDKVTMGDLMKRTTALSFLPLEEANHRVWTYGRVVCVGDAIHKMTPNLGQGGNQAIESAAVLTNCLLSLLSTNPSPSLPTLSSTLQKYQKLRQKRANLFVNLSGLVTRSDALAELKHTLRLLFMPPVSGEALADLQTEMYHTAPYLDFVPLPERTLNNELWKKGLERVRNNDTVPRPRL